MYQFLIIAYHFTLGSMIKVQTHTPLTALPKTMTKSFISINTVTSLKRIIVNIACSSRNKDKFWHTNDLLLPNDFDEKVRGVIN